MAYPQPPTGWARSGWVANQLIPDQNYHNAALQYLGGSVGTPASQPAVSGTPRVNGQTLSTAPNSLYNQQASWQMPEWLNKLLFNTGVPEQTAAPKPAQTTALQQQASVAPAGTGFSTPQSGYKQFKKPRGLFGTILDLSPGSPTGFMSGGTFGGII